MSAPEKQPPGGNRAGAGGAVTWAGDGRKSTAPRRAGGNGHTRGLAARTSHSFDRTRLPAAGEYYIGVGLRLIGAGPWRSAVCPFHEDSRPSLRVNVEHGGFRCLGCGAHGGDVLAFHRLRTGEGFVEAAQALGALVRSRR